jgi:serine/threonine protein phosphatase PrpC
MSDDHHFTFQWLGSENAYFDNPFTTNCGDIVIGCYGGNTIFGANKNEDAALVWNAINGSWKFALLLDAHTTSQSARLVLDTIQIAQAQITSMLDYPLRDAISSVHQYLIRLFASEAFKTKCRQVAGETACLVCVQKEQFLYWLSIGDCQIYLLHPELAHLGQYALNQRNFYEWVGQVNSFDLQTPCYSSGVRELRHGDNWIFLVTDGLLECGSRPFEEMQSLYETLVGKTKVDGNNIDANILKALQKVHIEQGHDSATIIGWRYTNYHTCGYPSQE